MMEIEFEDENMTKWVDIEDNELMSFWTMVSETTGRWRVGGGGKPYDIVHPVL